MGAAHHLDDADGSEDQDHGGLGAPPHAVEEGEGPWLVSYADLMTLLMGFFALISSMSTIDKGRLEKVKESASKAFGAEYEQPYQKLGQVIEKFIKENGLEEKVKVEVDELGATLTFTGTMLFDSGDFKVRPEAADIMARLGQVIVDQPEAYKALIEGHTDSVPISHPIVASNWELSSLRASRIAQLFERVGFKRDQLTIIGWGDTKPIAQERNQQGTLVPEAMAENRRVVLRVYDPDFTEDPVKSSAIKNPTGAAPPGQ